MKIQDKNKGENKLGKNLVLKATNETTSVEDEETTYIANKVFKALRKLGALLRRGESSRHMREERENDTWHKYRKMGHYIKDFPMHKVEYKEFVKQPIEQENSKYWVPGKYNRNVDR